MVWVWAIFEGGINTMVTSRLWDFGEGHPQQQQKWQKSVGKGNVHFTRSTKNRCTYPASAVALAPLLVDFLLGVLGVSRRYLSGVICLTGGYCSDLRYRCFCFSFEHRDQAHHLA
ncbi:unnamed protein product [Hapterophycus canaliculatus]